MYEDNVEKGDIKYMNRYKQLLCFRGLLRHRGITPTDIDGFIDYNGNAFVYLESKLVNKEMDVGQRRAFENIIKSHVKAGKPSIYIVFEHNDPPEIIIDVSKKYVKSIYYPKDLTKESTCEWDKEIKDKTVLDIIVRFENILTKYGISI